jgi:sulfite exporter TauE/SafE
MLGACLVAGSAFQGLQFALAFVLGTVPMLWAAHGSLGMLTRRISPRRMMQLQRGLALGAAVLLAWRLKGTLEPQPDGAEAAVSCPLCHD